MRTSILILVGLLVPAVVPAQRGGPAAACTTSTVACTEWVTLGGGPGRSMIYRTYSLDVPNDRIRRALVMVHGTNRNADHYFGTAASAAFLAGALEDTVVIAPHMIDSTDKAEANEVVWESSWRTGGPSRSHPSLSSFDLVDELLRKLANRSVFPNLKAIVVAGHSAGGQLANRYEMGNRVHDTVGVPVTYVVANPSSYAWPDPVRPLPQGDADPATAKEGWNQRDQTPLLPHTAYTFGPFDSTKAPGYNRWPAGFENRTGYTEKTTDAQLKKQLIERPTTYLLGQVDTLPLGGFDSSPNAMAQGPTRRSRGEAFFKYVTETLGAKHALMIVPECGHNDRCIFTTDIVFPALFPGRGALLPVAASAQAVVTVDRNTGVAATHAFKFARVPSPSATDAATKAKLVLVDGEMDPNAGSFSALNDGLLPRDEDEPGANFFFDAATPGGRFAINLTGPIDIAQVNSYSWHPNTRGPQVYTLYASDGSDPKFNAAPAHGVDPTTVGWKRIAAVDTRPQGNDTGGQYGVSITDPSGSLGKFQYVLFDCAATEMLDDYGNTFYSEIDVIQKAATPPTRVRAAPSSPGRRDLRRHGAHRSRYGRQIAPA